MMKLKHLDVFMAKYWYLDKRMNLWSATVNTYTTRISFSCHSLPDIWENNLFSLDWWGTSWPAKTCVNRHVIYHHCRHHHRHHDHISWTQPATIAGSVGVGVKYFAEN